MALSLLQHIRDEQHANLSTTLQKNGLNLADASSLVNWVIPLVLAHLVDLNQRHGTGLVLALVNTQAVDGLWQTLDQERLIGQVQRHINSDGTTIIQSCNQIADAVLSELFILVDTASLGEDGLNELLEGQPEHLQGQAPEWVWSLSGLTVNNNTATPANVAEPLDLVAGMASLNQLMQQAAQQPAEPHMHTDHHVDIVLPTQRAAGNVTRILEPLIALALLLLLYVFFMHSHQQIVPAAPLVTTPVEQVSTNETPLIPEIISDESALPPLPEDQSQTINIK
ncbi:MAG: hypothetical protein VXW65_13915 [Pseudomonadota bacterium]|nr:hypothetical protein [Pseudomonadota bacterium]